MPKIERTKLKGFARVRVVGPDGSIKEEEFVENLITTIGDQYYAERGANDATPTTNDVTGMKLGTGTTAASKSGAGATLVTYISGSNNLFDSTPAVAAVGSDVGYTIEYETSWLAGDTTNAAITEAIITNDAATDATDTASEVIARIVFTAKNKTADDSLVITWLHLFEGA